MESMEGVEVEDGRIITTGSSRQLNIWSMNDKNIVKNCTIGEICFSLTRIGSSDESEAVATGSSENGKAVRLFSISKNSITLQTTLKGHCGRICALDCHFGGKFLGSGCMGKITKLWTRNESSWKKKCHHTFKEASQVRSLRFLGETNFFAVGIRGSGVVKVRDFEKLTDYHSYSHNLRSGYYVFGMDYNEKRSLLSTIYYSPGNLILYDIRKKQCVKRISFPSSFCYSVLNLSDIEEIVVGGDKGSNSFVVDLRTFGKRKKWKMKTSSAYRMIDLPNHVCTCGNKIQLYERGNSWKLKGEMKNSSGYVRGVCYFPNKETTT